MGFVRLSGCVRCGMTLPVHVLGLHGYGHGMYAETAPGAKLPIRHGALW